MRIIAIASVLYSVLLGCSEIISDGKNSVDAEKTPLSKGELLRPTGDAQIDSTSPTFVPFQSRPVLIASRSKCVGKPKLIDGILTLNIDSFKLNSSVDIPGADEGKIDICTVVGNVSIPTNHILTVEPQVLDFQTIGDFLPEDFAIASIRIDNSFKAVTTSDVYASQVKGPSEGTIETVFVKSDDASSKTKISCADVKKTHSEVEFSVKLQADVEVRKDAANPSRALTIEYLKFPSFKLSLIKCL